MYLMKWSKLKFSICIWIFTSDDLFSDCDKTDLSSNNTVRLVRPSDWNGWDGRRETDCAPRGALRPFVSMTELTFHVPALFLPPFLLLLPSLLPQDRDDVTLRCKTIYPSDNNSPFRERGQIMMGGYWGRCACPLVILETFASFKTVTTDLLDFSANLPNSSQNYQMTSFALCFTLL